MVEANDSVIAARPVPRPSLGRLEALRTRRNLTVVSTGFCAARTLLVAALVSATSAIGWGLAPPSSSPEVAFVDEAAEAGSSSATSRAAPRSGHPRDHGRRRLLPRPEGDGDLDVYIVNGAPSRRLRMRRPRPATPSTSTTAAAVSPTHARSRAGRARWGGGCTAGDYDNDGDPDLYVTNFGRERLLAKRGGGHVPRRDRGRRPRRTRGWSLGAAFFDADRDGDLDLYVANYLHFDLAEPGMPAGGAAGRAARCSAGRAASPASRTCSTCNAATGRFEDASAAAGVAGRCALSAWACWRATWTGTATPTSSWPTTPRPTSCSSTTGGGRFADRALRAGVALRGDGRAQAGMGADLGDADGDGDEDLFVTHFSDDYHTLYRNDGRRPVHRRDRAAGLDAATRSSLGWAAGFFDYDNDGDLDLFVASRPRLSRRWTAATARPATASATSSSGTTGAAVSRPSPRLRPGLWRCGPAAGPRSVIRTTTATWISWSSRDRRPRAAAQRRRQRARAG